MSSKTRHGRIQSLYQKARTGKYNWDQLRDVVRAMGVSETTVTGYLADVRAMLVKDGSIRA